MKDEDSMHPPSTGREIILLPCLWSGALQEYFNLDRPHLHPISQSVDLRPSLPPPQRPPNSSKPCQKISLCVTMGELSWLLTVYELAFLLFRVKEAAQVEDDGQKEHEAGHGDDRHRLLAGVGTIEILTPQSACHVHLKGGREPNAT